MVQYRLAAVNLCTAILVILILTASNPQVKFDVPLSQLPVVLPGDLVFRRADSIGSQFVDTLDNKSTFSHVGIVYTTLSGEAFIIHVLPLEKDVVQIEPLQVFLIKTTSFAIYRPQNIDKLIVEGAVQNALSWVGKKHFDKNFDLVTDEDLYCTELVYKAYKEAGIDIVDGKFNIVDFAFVDVKEVIYPSLIIENGSFTLVYSNLQ